MTDLAWLTIAEAAALLKARKLSPVEYVDALLARVADLDPQLDTFIEVTGAIARTEAKAAEAEIAAGDYRGPMHGVPYGLKDIIDYAGVRTTAHSNVLIDNVPTADATATAKLKAAGAVLLGKLATHEFATGGPIFDLPFPPARNPWNRDHHPGGSSSGSGAALAAGFLPAALGTDTRGSIRNPASSCGIVGMKPTYGRVSRRGVVPLAFSLDHVGPMTRTVEDNAILLNAIAGHDPADLGSADVPVSDYTADLTLGVKGLKIGVIRHFYNRDKIISDVSGASIEAAIAELEKLGAEIVEVEVAPLEAYTLAAAVISPCESFSVHEKWLKAHPEKYGSYTRSRVFQGASLRAVDYLKAQRERARLTAAMNETMAGLDAVITATSLDPACRIDDWPALERTHGRSCRVAFNVTGHPALALPTGFASNGMPLGMQIAGKAFDEATILRVGHAYQRATGWHTQHPTLTATAKAAAE